MNWKYAVAFGISLLLFLLLFMQTDLARVIDILKNANLALVAVGVFLTIVNLASKVVRWKFFLDAYRIKAKRMNLVSTYLASLFLGNVIPARIGEVSRSYFLKKRHKTPFFYSLPIVLVERFLDMVALLIVSMLFLLFYSLFVSEVMKLAMILTFLAILAVIIVMLNKAWMKRAVYWTLRLLSMKKYLGKIDKLIDNFYRGIAKVRSINIAPIVLATFISLLCEVLILYFAALSLGMNLDISLAFGFLALSLLGGTISSLPGGLGSTEAILFTMFLLLGTGPALALSIALLSRFLSYFLAVLFSFPFFLREVKQ